MNSGEPGLLIARILRSEGFRGEPELGQALLDAFEREPNSALTDPLRAALRAYFEQDGRHEPMRAGIPLGQSRLYFYAAPEERPRQDQAEQFWAPHLTGDLNLLLHGEVNADGRRLVPMEEHYAALCIATWLQKRGGRLEMRPAADVEPLPAGVPLILIGNGETNPWVPEGPLNAIERIAPGETHGVITVIRTLAAALASTQARP